MASTPSSTLTVIFNNVLWSFSNVLLPICFILGNLGNCLNLVVFSQRTSRVNSCLLYFFSASIINILILNFGLVLRILRGIWNIDPAVQFLWFCRWRTHLTSTFFLIYRCSILFACFDRMCASSRSAWLRHISQPKVAHRLIAITWILCVVYFVPSLIFPVILYGQCISPPNTIYSTYITVSTLILAFIIPLLMIICGMITVCHLKKVQSRVTPGNVSVQNERRMTQQFLIMLLVQVAADCICNVAYPTYLIYNLIYPPPQSAQITAISSFLINLAFNVPYVNYSASFYFHTLSSPAFRRKLLRVLLKIPVLQRILPIRPDEQFLQTMKMNTIHPGRTAVNPHSNTQVHPQNLSVLYNKNKDVD